MPKQSKIEMENFVENNKKKKQIARNRKPGSEKTKISG